ncbi:MAG: DUF3253 domain-containing protein [Planctomycetota bacterium]
MTAQQAILELLRRRGPGKSICPSEAARLMAPADWRPQMPAVHAAAATLAGEGRLLVTQRGETVAPAAARGPVRLRLP